MTTLALVLVAVCCAADGELTSREVIRQQVRPNGQANEALIADTGWQTVHGFSWQLLAVNAATGAQTGVKADQVFRTGQPFKLRVQALTDLYIYVLNRNSGGGVATLFPEQSEQHLLISAGSAAKVPPDPPEGRDEFSFTKPAGDKGPPYVEQFYIIASPNKLDWANPAQHLPPAQKAANEKALDDLVNPAGSKIVFGKTLAQAIKQCKQTRAAGEKDVELVAPPTDGGQQVVHASQTPNDTTPLWVRVELRHQ